MGDFKMETDSTLLMYYVFSNIYFLAHVNNKSKELIQASFFVQGNLT
jgi:hypothetical protein